MDYETREKISQLEARIKELEAKLTMASLPEEAAALLDDLRMVPDTQNERWDLTLDVLDEFIKDMGYQTIKYPEINLFQFTDMFNDYELKLLDNNKIRLSYIEDIDSDTDRNMIYLLVSTQDLSAEVEIDSENDRIIFTVHSIELKPDTFRDSVRFFIGLLNDSARRLNYFYCNAISINKTTIRKRKYS